MEGLDSNLNTNSTNADESSNPSTNQETFTNSSSPDPQNNSLYSTPYQGTTQQNQGQSISSNADGLTREPSQTADLTNTSSPTDYSMPEKQTSAPSPAATNTLEVPNVSQFNMNENQVPQSPQTPPVGMEIPEANDHFAAALSGQNPGLVTMQTPVATMPVSPKVSSKNQTLILSIVIPIVLIIGLLFGGFFYAKASFNKSVANVDNLRQQQFAALQKLYDEDDQMSLQVNKLDDDNATFDDLNNAFTEVENINKEYLANVAIMTDSMTSQGSAFNPKLTLFLTPSQKKAITDIKTSLAKSSANAKPTLDANTADQYARIAIFRCIIDYYLASAVDSSLGDGSLSLEDALKNLNKLQNYTQSNFSFENESLYRASLPVTYSAIKTSQKFFAQYYNIVSGAVSGTLDFSTVDQEIASMMNQSSNAEAALDNALDEKNKAWADIYISEIAAADSYIAAIQEANPKINLNRDIAYYVAENLQYNYYKDNQFPKVSNFDALKQTLGLKYGTSDNIQYLSQSEGEFTIQYKDASGNWQKLDYSLPVASNQSQPSQST